MAGSSITLNYRDPIAPPENVTVPLSTESLTGSLVAERFAGAASFSTTAFYQALEYLDQLTNIVPDIGTDWVHEPPPPVEFPPGLGGLTPVNPTLAPINPIEVAPVEFPYQPPATDGLPVILARDIPEFNIPLPDFFIPDAPDDEVPDFTATAPATGGIILPNKPDYVMPPIPQLSEVIIPTEPEYNTFSFDELPPDCADLEAPDALFVYNEAEYDSELLETLKIKLRDGILNGGVGMLPEVEQAIYDRAVSRLNVELQEEESIAFDQFASRGSRLPGGALLARLDTIQTKSIQAREDLTNDIMVKSADLAYRYSEFVIKEGIALEHDLMAFANDFANRAFEAAKFGLEYLFTAFNAKVELCRVRADLYKIAADVYESKIRAEIAKAELYKSIIEGRRLSLQMQELFVSLYEKQVAAIATIIDLYRAEMEGSKIEATIQGQEIENFRTLTLAYKEQVGAVVAKYNLHQAIIAGESEKAGMYAKQVDGYKSHVEAVKVASDIDISQLTAALQKIGLDVDIFKSRLGKYGQDIQANIADAEIQAKAEDLKIKVFDGEIKEFTATVDALTKTYIAQSDVLIAGIQADIEYGKVISQIEIAKADLNRSIVEAQAKIASQLASAALTSVSAGASLQYTQRRSDSTANNLGRSHTMSDSNAYSRRDALSENHSFAQKCCGD